MFKSINRNLTRFCKNLAYCAVLCGCGNLIASENQIDDSCYKNYETLFIQSAIGFYEINDFDMFEQLINRFCTMSDKKKCNEFILKLNNQIFDKYIRAMRITSSYYLNEKENGKQDDDAT